MKVRGSLPYIDDSNIREAPEVDFMADIPTILTGAYSHDIAADYDRGAGLDQSETLYFASGVKVNSKGEYNFQFKTSDLLTNFKIKTQTYGSVGMSYNVAKIKVADPFAFNFKLPKTIVKGDTVNVTMTISNFNPTWIIFTPTVVDPSENLDVSFKYSYLSGKTTVFAETYNVTANNTNYQVVFTVTAKKPVDNAVLTISLAGSSSDGKNNFVEYFS